MVGTSRGSVPDELRVLAGRRPHGVVTLAAAAEAGIAAEEVARWVRAGVMVRLFRGTYVLAEVWDAASSEGRHVLRGIAHVLALEGRSVLSHTTAAAFHGLPLLAPPPERVHLSRRQPGQGRSGRGFVVHETYGTGAEHVDPPRPARREPQQPPRQAGGTAESAGRGPHGVGQPAGGTAESAGREPHGVGQPAGGTAESAGRKPHGGDQPAGRTAVTAWAVLPVLAALGVAELHGWVAGVMAVDAALHRGLTSVEAARGWLERMSGRPGVRLLRRVVDAADPLCESPLETQVRLLLMGLGYRVVAQHVLRTEAGEFVARVDFWLPDLGVVVEADGAVKYVTADGAADHAAVRSERRRHHAIEVLGHPVVRLEQHDVTRPESVRQRIEAAAARARRW